jgi:hypothetical protein
MLSVFDISHTPAATSRETAPLGRNRLLFVVVLVPANRNHLN